MDISCAWAFPGQKPTILSRDSFNFSFIEKIYEHPHVYVITKHTGGVIDTPHRRMLRRAFPSSMQKRQCWREPWGRSGCNESLVFGGS